MPRSSALLVRGQAWISLNHSDRAASFRPIPFLLPSNVPDPEASACYLAAVPRSESSHAEQAQQWFETTHWSVVQATAGESSVARRALEELCRTYWYPLYAYARRAGRSAHDAEDSVQSFFLRCLEKEMFSTADRAKGRFRTFMLVAFKRFAANEFEKSRTLKRGGGQTLLELDALTAEERYRSEPSDIASADKLYDRRWALTLLEQVLHRLEREQTAAGQHDTFAALKEFLTGRERGTPYGEIAKRLGVSEGAIKTAVHRLRQRYRELLETEIAHTVASPDEIGEERRHLLNALAG